MHDTCSKDGGSYKCRLQLPLLLHLAYIHIRSVKQSSEHTWLLQNAIYYAYFAPYSYERHQDLIAKVIGHKRVKLQILGETLDGHDIDFLQIGTALSIVARTSAYAVVYFRTPCASRSTPQIALVRCSAACYVSLSSRASLHRWHMTSVTEVEGLHVWHAEN